MNNFPKKVYLNGKIVDYKDAKISVFDRGFLFGDGIYEVMLKINGSFFYGKEHLDRLSNCLQKIRIDFDISILPDTLINVLEASNLENDDGLIYIQITRGMAPRKHAFPANTEPTLMIYMLPFEVPDINKTNTKIITMPDYRWHRCDIKMTSLLGNVMANDNAVNLGYHESVFVRDEHVTEGSHSNIFFVKDTIVYTHPANEYILDGITRQIVIALCSDLNIVVKEKVISKKDITFMDEAFLTGTTTQIAAIKQIDDHFFYKDDQIGPVTQKLQNAFLYLKKKKSPEHFYPTEE